MLVVEFAQRPVPLRFSDRYRQLDGGGAPGYDISPCATILAGYRYPYLNNGPGGGAGARLTLQGPGVGLAYKF